MQTVPLSRCLKGSQIRLLEHKFSCYFQEKLWLTAENIDYFWLQLKKSIKFLKILKYLIQYLWRLTKGYKVATSGFSFSRIRLDSNAAVNKIFKTWLIPNKTSVVESNPNAWFPPNPTFIVLGDEIWSPQIRRPKFVAWAFPPLSCIQF